MSGKATGTLKKNTTPPPAEEQPATGKLSTPPRKQAQAPANRKAAPPATPSKFAQDVRKVQAKLTSLRDLPSITPDQARDIENIETRLQEAAAEAARPKPDAARIDNLLGNTHMLLERLSPSLEAAAKLRPTVRRLQSQAKKTFAASNRA
jgi:hypothetical protein